MKYQESWLVQGKKAFLIVIHSGLCVNGYPASDTVAINLPNAATL